MPAVPRTATLSSTISTLPLSQAFLNSLQTFLYYSSITPGAWCTFLSGQFKEHETMHSVQLRVFFSILCFTTIFSSSYYITQSNTVLYFFVPVVYVHNDVLKNSKFPARNDFQFCLIARQADRVKILSHSSLCTRDLGWIENQNTVR